MNAADLANDCLSLDGSETVSVTLRRPQGRTTLTVAAALRRSLARDLREFEGVTLRGDEIVWHIPGSLLGAGQELQPGDTISVGVEVWSIVRVQRETLGSRWRCTCRAAP
jgi:hypothetical protein